MFRFLSISDLVYIGTILTLFEQHFGDITFQQLGRHIAPLYGIIRFQGFLYHIALPHLIQVDTCELVNKKMLYCIEFVKSIILIFRPIIMLEFF
jgi:hypothetical protein